MQRSDARLDGLQTLRAMAALMVLIGHVRAEAEHFLGLDLPGAALPWTRGVDVFFVLSGFIIALSATRFPGRPLAFLKRRAWRVVPLYFLFTTLMVLSLLLLPSGVKDTTLDLRQILGSYTFWPVARPDGRIAPLLSLGWTLNYEMFFYALMALALCTPRPVLSLSAALISLSALSLLDWQTTEMRFWTNPILLEFLLGMGLAQTYLRGWRLPGKAVLPLVVLGLALMILLHQTALPRFLAAGVPALILTAAMTAQRANWPLISLGDASYALYLSHRFTLRAATLLLMPLLPVSATGAALFILITCALSCAVALLVHSWIEKPLLSPPQRHRQTA